MFHAGISNCFDLTQVTTVALHSSVQQPCHAQRNHFPALLPIFWFLPSLCLRLQCPLIPPGGKVSI